MKPTHYTSPNRKPSRLDRAVVLRRHGSVPLTGCNFHPTVDAGASARSLPESANHVHELRAFRKITNSFFEAEAGRDYVTELALFVLITGASAWPIISMVSALARMLK